MRANSPPPACQPLYPLPLTNRQSNPVLLLLMPIQGYKVSFSSIQTEMKKQVLPGGHSTQKKMCLWFGGTSGGLWSGYEHIIMAIHIPAPQFVNESTKSHCQAAKSPEALPKSNCLVENPFTLCHSTECAPSSLIALHKSIHTSAWIAQ